MRHKYLMNAEGDIMVFDTLKEVAEALGVKKVTRKQIIRGKHKYISMVPSHEAQIPTGEYPELGDFLTRKELKDFCKPLINEQLEYWVKLEGLEFRPSSNHSITRMKLVSLLIKHHFPEYSIRNLKKCSTKVLIDKVKLKMLWDEDLVTLPDPLLRMKLIVLLKNQPT